MTAKRKLIVNFLATVAFIVLFLLPILGFMANETGASETAQSAVSSGDYVFFVVQNDDVPLAAAPSAGSSSYLLWIALSAFVLMIFFIYSAWYLSVRRNLNELSYKLSPSERRALTVSNSFLHPFRCYQLSKEAEDTVASLYINL